MGLYLYGITALKVMRYLRSTNGGKVPGEPERPRKLRNAICTNRQLNKLGYSAELMLSHAEGQIHALVSQPSQLRHTSRLVTHLWTNELPSGTYLDLGNGIHLPMPQFLFLQLASFMTELELIAVGLELCGFYSKWKFSRPRSGLIPLTESDGTTFNLLPALRAQQLVRFLERMKGARGAVLARKAAQRVLNDAASPMEANAYLLFCLPRHMGGYGLPKPLFNAKVTVTTSTRTDKRYPDLFWPGRGIDVECQSDFAHSGELYRIRDSVREVELIAEKIVVLPLTKHQLEDPAAFAAFVSSLRRSLGKRSRPLDAAWAARHAELRQQLLFDWRKQL